MLYDNTTVTGSWVLQDTSDITTAHQKYNRVINNVSLAMPHAGILAAAQDSKNSILQPEDLAGVGQLWVPKRVFLCESFFECPMRIIVANGCLTAPSITSMYSQGFSKQLLYSGHKGSVLLEF